MHDAAYRYAARWASDRPIRVLEIGSLNINGTTRDHFPNADYTGLDIVPGPGVDIVANAATWTPDREYDVVICQEVFEHTPDVVDICLTAYRAARRGAHLVVTCAGEGRAPHSAVDGGQVRSGEYYRNVDLTLLRAAIVVAGWGDVEVQQVGEDLQAHAVKR